MKAKVITTQKEVRDLFWDSFPEFAKERRANKKQNSYKCDIRTSFVSFVDSLSKDGTISNKLAYKVTL